MQAESTELLTQPLPLRRSGALSGDTFAFTSSAVATPSSPAGTYSIVPVATGANLANYNVVYVNGALTVDKATLTVTPNNQSSVAGSVLPSLSATITGFVNGDTQTAVTGQPALTTTATSSYPAGSYPIDYCNRRNSCRRQLQLYLRGRHPHHHHSSRQQSGCQLHR